MDGGGVASCRELVLDYVEDINWKVNAEIGNDYKQVPLLLSSAASPLYHLQALLLSHLLVATEPCAADTLTALFCSRCEPKPVSLRPRKEVDFP